MVLVAGGGAAGGEDGVGLGGAAVEGGGHRLGGCRAAWPRSTGIMSQRRRMSSEHRAVGVEGLVRRGGAARGADLVAGGEHRDAQAAADGERAEAHGGGERQVLRGEAAALGQDLGALVHVLAGGAGVGAGLRPRSKRMASAVRVTSSSRTTVSTPAGRSAPVRMRSAWPEGTAPA